MDVFAVAQLLSSLAPDKRDVREFFRSPSESLSMSILRRPAGTQDSQQPHTEDEVYYVVLGRAIINIAGEEAELGPGSIVFVPAGVEHRFTETIDDLEMLVFWSPARHSRGPEGRASHDGTLDSRRDLWTAESDMPEAR